MSSLIFFNAKNEVKLKKFGFWKWKRGRACAARASKFADQNIHDRQQCVHFRKSQKVVNHSTLPSNHHWVTCRATWAPAVSGQAVGSCGARWGRGAAVWPRGDHLHLVHPAEHTDGKKSSRAGHAMFFSVTASFFECQIRKGLSGGIFIHRIDLPQNWRGAAVLGQSPLFSY